MNSRWDNEQESRFGRRDRRDLENRGFEDADRNRRYQQWARYNADGAYGGQGDDRDFQYEFERGGQEGYRGMSRREQELDYDEMGGPQRYSAYPGSGVGIGGRGNPYPEERPAQRQVDSYRQGGESFGGGRYRGEGVRSRYDAGTERFGSGRGGGAIGGQYSGQYGSPFSGRSRYHDGGEFEDSPETFPSMTRGQFAGRGPKGYHRSDERIRDEICERLMQHPDIDATDIEVQVQNGEVTLTGSARRHCKRMAEDLAEIISGVKDVRNEIRARRDENAGSTNAGGTGQEENFERLSK